MITPQENELAALRCQVDQLSRKLEQSQLSERELQEARAAAESASRSKSEFLANMSHEIRTPLTAILGYAEILKDQVTDAEGREAAHTIERNGRYLLKILNDVLDLSKLEADRLEILPERCAPVEIVHDVFRLMSVRAQAKALKFDVDFEGAIPQSIETDPVRLRQILINLVGNAIKFTELGYVRLVARLSDRQPEQIVFQVIDSGIGIAPEQIAQIFEPFVQGDASTTRRFGGSGLGLSICRRLSRLLGGDVSVRSQIGQGSCFTVTIATGPLRDVKLLTSALLGSAVSCVERSSVSSEPQLSCRALFAEDGPDNQRIVSFFLRKAGVDVTLATNGMDAVHKALATQNGFGRRSDDPTVPFDIILMDMQMPVMDGYEATRFIRSKGYRGPIVALTASAMNGDEQKCRAAGCDAFLTKPVHRQNLIETMARLVRSDPQPQLEREAAVKVASRSLGAEP